LTVHQHQDMTATFFSSLAAIDVVDDSPVRETGRETLDRLGVEVGERDVSRWTNDNRGVLQCVQCNEPLAIEDELPAAGQDDVA